MESQLLGAAREIPRLTVASLHGEIRREGRDAATWAKKLENRPAWTKAPCHSALVVSRMAATARAESQLPWRALIVILVASLRMTPWTLQHHAKRCGGARAD